MTSCTTYSNSSPTRQKHRMKLNVSLIAIVFLVLLSINCGESAEGIKNQNYAFKTEKAYSSDDADNPYFFGSVLNICANSRYIYVSDWKMYSIKIFDHNFNLVNKIGRKGNGPGEFGQIFAGMTCNEDKIFLITINRLYTFSAGGEFESEATLKFFPRNVYATRNGLLFKRDNSKKVFAFADTKGSVKESFLEADVIVSEECGRLTAPPNAFLTSSGNLFLMDSRHYKIELLNLLNREKIFSISRDVDFQGIHCTKNGEGSVSIEGGIGSMFEGDDSFYYFYYDTQKRHKLDIYAKKSGETIGLLSAGNYTSDIIPRCAVPGTKKFIGVKPDEASTIYMGILDRTRQ